MSESNRDSQELTLVVGGTGKTGSRVVDRLSRRGMAVRAASRSTNPGFTWEDPSTWARSLEGVTQAYVTFAPDLAIPGAPEAVSAFTDLAVEHGVKKLVLLSGRGEEEAQRAETMIQRPGLDWTVVRASWFAQNFSEGPFRDMVLQGEIALPVADIGEPFVDADDIADVVAAALTEEGHEGNVYEVTGPRLLTFREAAEAIGQAAGRPVRFQRISTEAFTATLTAAGLPDGVAWLMDYLFTTVLDGRNAHTTDGVRRALGREPRDFVEYAALSAAAGTWREA